MTLRYHIAVFRCTVLFGWYLIKNDLKRILKQLMNWKTLLLFLLVMAVMSSEVWVMYLLAIITGNNYWWGIGSACWAFWLGPGTPFIPLCIAITLGIRGAWISFKERKKKNDLYSRYKRSN